MTTPWLGSQRIVRALHHDDQTRERLRCTIEREPKPMPSLWKPSTGLGLAALSGGTLHHGLVGFALLKRLEPVAQVWVLLEWRRTGL